MAENLNLKIMEQVKKREIIIPCVAWFVIITFISILLSSCASGAHCNAYGKTDVNIEQEKAQSSLASSKR